MFGISALPAPSIDAGLSKYLAEIRKFPMLKPEEELACARRWREHRDRDAAFQLVTSHLRLVAKIAMRYRGYGLPIAEIVSEGNIGLMQAVKRFDPDPGVPLAPHALWGIQAPTPHDTLPTSPPPKIPTHPPHPNPGDNVSRGTGDGLSPSRPE